MALKKFRPYTSTRRFMTVPDFSELAAGPSVRALLKPTSGSGGRNSYGRMTNVNVGGGHKQLYRVIDFKRNKIGIPGVVAALEYDPNRSARIALINYKDGERRYIIAPNGLTVGQTVISGPDSEIRPGNALPLKNIPVGQNIYNIELRVGRGGQLVRSAGNTAQLMAKEGEYVTIKLPSGEMRKVLNECYATIGEVGNADHSNMDIGKAGRSRWLGVRPHNRGIARNPVDHPNGGRTNGGKHFRSLSGVLSKGGRTRKNKRTQKYIVRSRHEAKRKK